MSRIGFFNSEPHNLLKDANKPTFITFLLDLLKVKTDNLNIDMIGEKQLAETIVKFGYCKDQGTAERTAKTIMYAFHFIH